MLPEPAVNTHRKHNFIVLLLLGLIAVASSDELDILLTLKTALSESKSEVFDSWNSEKFICNFTGITCDDTLSSVKEIVLTNQSLVGSIPFDSICQLNSLQKLDFMSNKLYGFVTQDLNKCSKLTYLDLGDNLFSGSFPDISSMNQLLYLYMDNNGFTGTFPWASLENMTKLVHLVIGDNPFDPTHQFPKEVLKLTHLNWLDMWNSSIWGEIPNGIGKLTELNYLDISMNSITGKLPNGIGQLTELITLDISSNSITGSFPWTSLGNMTKLVQLRVANNPFDQTDKFPNEVYNLTRLKVLHMFNCSIGGEIPTGIAELTELTSFDISWNSITGKLPMGLRNLTNLEDFYAQFNFIQGDVTEVKFLIKLKNLDLSDNEFVGVFPPEIGDFKQLVSLSLGSNKLNGTLPKQLGSWSDINMVNVFNNSLTGEIPPDMCKNGKMTVLLLLQNQFTGKIPGSYADCKTLTRFRVGENLLSGVVPVGIWWLPRANIIDMANNALEGNIDPAISFTNHSSLEVLLLQGNRFTGTIPGAISKLTSLTYINLDDNMFHGTLPQLPINIIAYSVNNNTMVGEIPSSFCNSRSLEVFQVSHNYISGTLPNCFQNDSRLTILNLYDNRLHGLVPRSLVNCRNLEVLNLGENTFSDMFPSWLDALPQLQVLILKYNMFHGAVQTSSNSEFPFPKLRILDLSGNLFTGHLPWNLFKSFKAMMNASVGQVPNYMSGVTYGRYEYSVELVVKGMELTFERILTVLTTIDLSSNKFEGEISNSFRMLNSLRYLNLSHNHLSGQVPSTFGNLTNLESLDLSSNKLKGKIPSELTRLTFVAFLNVSSNQLSGAIPQGGQFNTFENSSYLGNPMLCGFPLSKNCGDNHDRTIPLLTEQEDVSAFFEGFTWKSVVTGYGCGIVIGLSLGYFMFKTRKPKWLMKIVNERKRA